MRQEAIKEAEERRRVKHKKMEEERENMRQGIRDKYKIEKRQDSEEEEEDEDDDDFGMTKKKEEEELDPMQRESLF